MGTMYREAAVQKPSMMEGMNPPTLRVRRADPSRCSGMNPPLLRVRRVPPSLRFWRNPFFPLFCVCRIIYSKKT